MNISTKQLKLLCDNTVWTDHEAILLLLDQDPMSFYDACQFCVLRPEFAEEYYIKTIALRQAVCREKILGNTGKYQQGVVPHKCRLAIQWTKNLPQCKQHVATLPYIENNIEEYPPVSVEPSIFIDWARQLGWKVPKKLVNAVKNRPGFIDWEAEYKALEIEYNKLKEENNRLNEQQKPMDSRLKTRV